MLHVLVALLLLIATPAHAEEKPTPPSEVLRAVTSQPVWLNTPRALTPEDLHGRIVLLDFWTLGCINCMDIIPDLKALEHEFGEKLTVIGVHSAKFANEKDTENIRNAILRYGLAHPVVNDADFAIWNKFGVRAWPTLVLIGPKGIISKVYAGEGHRAELEVDIKKLLDKYGDAVVTSALPLALESSKIAASELRFPGKITWGDIASGLYMPILFVADSGHNRILIINPDGNRAHAIGDGSEGFRDGSFDQAQFFKPQGMAYMYGGLFVADLGNHALRFVDVLHNKVRTVAGTGHQGHILEQGEHAALKTALSSPWDVALFPDDKHLAIANAGTHQLLSYDIERHTISVLAGNGSESIEDGVYPHNALSQPSGLLAMNGKLYFTDAESSSLRVMDKDGTVTTLIGKGLFYFGYKEGTRDTALLQHCLGLTGDGKNIYIADTYNHSIRRYDVKEGKLHNFAGHDSRGAADGKLAAASFNEPGGIALLDNALYVADTNNHSLRVIDLKKHTVSTFTNSSPIRAEAGRGAVVAPESAAPMPELGELPHNLPNQQALSFTVEQNTDIEVSLALKPGWHINHDAPSQLGFYIQADTNMRKALFDRAALAQGHVTLPKLHFGYTHRLIGTLYYCEDKAGSLCMIKSFDVTLKSGGKDKAITLPVY